MLPMNPRSKRTKPVVEFARTDRQMMVIVGRYMDRRKYKIRVYKE